MYYTLICQNSLILECNHRKIKSTIFSYMIWILVFSVHHFVVAAVSPGGDILKPVSNFGKTRGDGKWTVMFFLPL